MVQKFVLKNALSREIDQETETVLDRARQERERILEDARREADRRRRKARELLDRDLRIRRRRALARAQMEGRNALLDRKKREVNEVFEQARRRLLAMEKEEPERFGELLWNYFDLGRAQLPDEPLRVRLGPQSDVMEDRLRHREKVEVLLEDGLHGMILETADGRVRCDCRLETLLARLQEDREAEIEGILFGEEHGEKG